MIVLKALQWKPYTLDDYVYPDWATALSWLIVAFPIVFIPAWILYYCACRDKRNVRIFYSKCLLYYLYNTATNCLDQSSFIFSAELITLHYEPPFSVSYKVILLKVFVIGFLIINLILILGINVQKEKFDIGFSKFFPINVIEINSS